MLFVTKPFETIYKVSKIMMDCFLVFSEQSTISRDFSNGYLIGEVLHKFELQDDFELFSKSR